MRRLNLRPERECAFTVLLLSLGFITQAHAQRTLTIKNANGQAAGVIDLANTAQVDFRVPQQASRLDCRSASILPASTTTANGSCDATAGARQITMAAVLPTLIQMGLRTQTISAPTRRPVVRQLGWMSPSQRDSDGDGVSDAADQCANTAAGATVPARLPCDQHQHQHQYQYQYHHQYWLLLFRSADGCNVFCLKQYGRLVGIFPRGQTNIGWHDFESPIYYSGVHRDGARWVYHLRGCLH